jgi:hypothetical protein
MTQNDRELIAAIVEGSLRPKDAARVLATIGRSPEARKLYDAMVRERDAVSALPFCAAPASVLPEVMARVESLNPWAELPTRSRPYHAANRWLPVAVAASLILLAGAGTWWGVQNLQRNQRELAHTAALPFIEFESANGSDEPPVVVTRIPQLDVSPIEDAPPIVEEAPAPRAGTAEPRPVYGAPPAPKSVLETLHVKLPLLGRMADLDQDDARKTLVKELSRLPQARIDLFCTDPQRAAEILVATGRAVGVNVVVESGAQERLKRKLGTIWLIYTESLTPEDAAQWLTRMGDANPSPAEKPVFESYHVPEIQPQDRKDLKDLLGLDSAKTKRPQPVATAGPPRREKTAILVTYLPQASRTPASQSREIRTWLERLEARTPGTLALTLVLRKP